MGSSAKIGKKDPRDNGGRKLRDFSKVRWGPMKWRSLDSSLARRARNRIHAVRAKRTRQCQIRLVEADTARTKPRLSCDGGQQNKYGRVHRDNNNYYCNSIVVRSLRNSTSIVLRIVAVPIIIRRVLSTDTGNCFSTSARTPYDSYPVAVSGFDFDRGDYVSKYEHRNTRARRETSVFR